MERELRTLTEEELSPGKAMIKKAITNSGQQLLNNAVLGATKFGLNSLADKVGGKNGDLIKSLITGNVDTTPKKQESAYDKLKKQVQTMALEEQYEKLTKSRRERAEAESKATEESKSETSSEEKKKK